MKTTSNQCTQKATIIFVILLVCGYSSSMDASYGSARGLHRVKEGTGRELSHAKGMHLASDRLRAVADTDSKKARGARILLPLPSERCYAALPAGFAPLSIQAALNSMSEAGIVSTSTTKDIRRGGRMLQESGVRFQENRGQFVDAEGKVRHEIVYKADVPGAQIYLRADGISTVFTRTNGEVDREKEEYESGKRNMHQNWIDAIIETYRMDMTLQGCNPAVRIHARDQVNGLLNFYLPQCPEGMFGIREFRRIVYEEVYEHIDLELLSVNGRLKYNFIVRPGGRPEQIRMRYDGAIDVSIREDGMLVVTTPLGSMEEAAPLCWTESDGTPVEARFVRQGSTVSFELKDYDHEKILIIDPWATYYGGNGDDRGYGVAVDSNGNVYLAGWTASTTNIAAPGAHQTTHGGNSDAFLVKFNSNGVRQWATYYGGSEHDRCYDVTLDSYGNVYMTGSTSSPTNIATVGAHQSTYGYNTDAFVAKFSTSGVRQWATYYGGSGQDVGNGIITDNSGNVYVTGYTTSTTNIAATNSHQSLYGGGTDAFLFKINANGVRQWATYYGGSAYDNGYGITSDASGNIYIIGWTESSTNIATPGAHQTVLAGGSDAFLVKFNSNGIRQWATYYGGASSDEGRSVTVDGYGNIYMTGTTLSISNISTAGALQQNYGGNRDAFIAKLSGSGAREWGTYYGGNAPEWGDCVTVDGSGNIFVSGSTGSTGNIATTGAYQTSYGGGIWDGYIVKISSSGVRLWGTYYGGNGTEVADHITLDAGGYVYIAGYTGSTGNIATARSASDNSRW
jgi:hypothetical protein